MHAQEVHNLPQNFPQGINEVLKKSYRPTKNIHGMVSIERVYTATFHALVDTLANAHAHAYTHTHKHTHTHTHRHTHTGTHTNAHRHTQRRARARTGFTVSSLVSVLSPVNHKRLYRVKNKLQGDRQTQRERG